MPPSPVSAKKLSKSGWVTHDTFKLLVGHRPKAFRTPVSRHACLFRDGSWSKAEDKVDMRTLGNKKAKLDSPAIMSLTIFERPEDDPEEVKVSTRMEFDLSAIRRVLKGPQRLHQNSGTTTRSNSARRTLPDGSVKFSCMRNMCAGNEGMRHQLCP